MSMSTATGVYSLNGRRASFRANPMDVSTLPGRPPEMTIATYCSRPTTRSLPSARFNISDQHAWVGKVVIRFTTVVESRGTDGRRRASEDDRDLGFGIARYEFGGSSDPSNGAGATNKAKNSFETKTKKPATDYRSRLTV